MTSRSISSTFLYILHCLRKVRYVVSSTILRLRTSFVLSITLSRHSWGNVVERKTCPACHHRLSLPLYRDILHLDITRNVWRCGNKSRSEKEVCSYLFKGNPCFPIFPRLRLTWGGQKAWRPGARGDVWRGLGRWLWPQWKKGWWSQSFAKSLGCLLSYEDSNVCVLATRKLTNWCLMMIRCNWWEPRARESLLWCWTLLRTKFYPQGGEMAFTERCNKATRFKNCDRKVW